MMLDVRLKCRDGWKSTSITFEVVQCFPEQVFIDSVLHEVVVVDVDHRNVVLVSLKPLLV